MLRSSGWVAKATGGDLVGADVPITGTVETDSRSCTAGSLYVARRGENADGHDYILAAVEAGAVCAVVEKQVGIDIPQVIVADATNALGALARAHLEDLREKTNIQVAGITGSAGKTTTKDLLGQVLSAVAPTVFPVASFNNEVGCPLTVLRSDAKTRYLVLEMGASGRGHLHYLTDIAPLDVAVELLVGEAHLEGFGSIGVLAQSKRELVEGLLPDGVAVLNVDDPNVADMASAATGRIIRFSAKGHEAAQLWAKNVELDPLGRPSFLLCTKDEEISVQLRIAGEHQVVNALAAAGAALALDLPLPLIAAELERSSAVSPHRMDVRREVSVAGSSGLTLIDDSYNANPDSMRSGLTAARQIAKEGRLVTVLGEMLELGDSSATLHAEVSKSVVAASPDVLVVVGENAGGLVPENGLIREVLHVETPSEVLHVLPELLADGDTVFLKGSYGSGVWKVADALLEGDGR